jgi:Acyl-CoA dehydrogenase, C-terminal domain
MIAGEDRDLFERSLRHATETRSGPALDAALTELGWQDALSADTHTAVSLLFELQGRANATSSALDHVLAHALGHPASAVVLPTIGRWTPPGTLDGDQLHIHGIAIAAPRYRPDGHGGETTGGSERDTALVVASVDESDVAFEVEVAALGRRVVEGLDPSLGLVEATGDVGGATELGPVDWRTAVAVGQLALSHELLGASRRMLELAREHALERVQFGRPIAMFQAVRHRLAETLVAVEAAGAALDAAWADQAPQTAAMAKASAGRAARVAARHCQQVLAGIGFTTEHPFHRYVKRTFVLEQLLGSPRTLTRQLGLDILERRQLPALLPL